MGHEYSFEKKQFKPSAFQCIHKGRLQMIRFMGREQKTNPDGIGIKPSGIKVW